MIDSINSLKQNNPIQPQGKLSNQLGSKQKNPVQIKPFTTSLSPSKTIPSKSNHTTMILHRLLRGCKNLSHNPRMRLSGIPIWQRPRVLFSLSFRTVFRSGYFEKVFFLACSCWCFDLGLFETVASWDFLCSPFVSFVDVFFLQQVWLKWCGFMSFGKSMNIGLNCSRPIPMFFFGLWPLAFVHFVLFLLQSWVMWHLASKLFWCTEQLPEQQIQSIKHVPQTKLLRDQQNLPKALQYSWALSTGSCKKTMDKQPSISSILFKSPVKLGFP